MYRVCLGVAVVELLGPGAPRLRRSGVLLGADVERWKDLGELSEIADPNQRPQRSGNQARGRASVAVGLSHIARGGCLAYRGNPTRQLTPRTLAGLYCSAWPDLVLTGGQPFGNQPSIGPRCRSCPTDDRVILQLEPLAGDFNEPPSVIGPEPANVIKAARKHLVGATEAATNHLVWHQHHLVAIDDLPPRMYLDSYVTDRVH
jgi:hypothetical protein